MIDVLDRQRPEVRHWSLPSCVRTALPGILVALLLFLSACSEGRAPELRPGEVSASPPDQEAWEWSTVVTREGRRRAIVTARHFARYDKERRSQLDEGVRVGFYDATGGTQVSQLTARRAVIDESNWDMEVSGNVVLVAGDSTRLETEVLRWHRKSDRITGEGQVTIRRAEGTETGVGFEATSDLKKWSLRHVTTHLRARQ